MMSAIGTALALSAGAVTVATLLLALLLPLSFALESRGRRALQPAVAPQHNP